MRIVGIDPSLRRTGVCVISDAGDVSVASLTTGNRDGVFFRQRNMVSLVKQCLRADDVVVLEEFGVSARFAPSGRFVERIELCGMLKLIAPAITRLPWLHVPPALLKSFVAGKSGARKEEMTAAVRLEWGMPVANDDEGDAFGLARYAQAVLSQETRFGKKLAAFEKYGENRAHLARIRFSLNAVLKKAPPVVEKGR